MACGLLQNIVQVTIYLKKTKNPLVYSGTKIQIKTNMAK